MFNIGDHNYPSDYDNDDEGTIIANERSVRPIPSTHLEIVIPRISNKSIVGTPRKRRLYKKSTLSKLKKKSRR